MADMTDLPALMDPRTMGILSAAFAGLNASGPSLMPKSLGQIAGIAGQQGLGTYQNAVQQQTQLQLMQQQIIAAQLANRLAGWKANEVAGAEGAQPESVPTAPGISPSTLQGAFPGMGSGTASALSDANTQPTRPPAVTNTGYPLVPGLDARQSQLAALGMYSPAYLSAVASANAPTDIQKMARAAAAGDPVAQAWIKKQTIIPPVANRGYGLMEPDANGHYVANPDSEAQIARTTGIKEGFNTVPYPNAAGREVPTFKSQIPGFPGAPAIAPAPPQPMVPTPQPGVSSSGAFPSGSLNLKNQSPEAIKQLAKEDPAFRQVAQEAGILPDPWQSMPKIDIPTGVEQGPYQKTILEEQGKAASRLVEAGDARVVTANQRIAYNNQALDLVDKAGTGPGALSIANVKNYLNKYVGVSDKTMDAVVSGDRNATVALNKDLLNAATQKAKEAYGSRMTQSEVMLQIKQGSPNVDMTAATIKYLLNTDNAMSKYQIKKSADLGKYIANKGDPFKFEGWYSENFPMSAVTEGIHLNSSAADSSPANSMVEISAKKAWGSYDPNKYEYKFISGVLHRRVKD